MSILPAPMRLFATHDAIEMNTWAVKVRPNGLTCTMDADNDCGAEMAFIGYRCLPRTLPEAQWSITPDQRGGFKLSDLNANTETFCASLTVACSAIMDEVGYRDTDDAAEAANVVRGP